MLVDPDAMVGTRTYCRRTRRLFWIHETQMWKEDKETGLVSGTTTSFDETFKPATHVAFYWMHGRYPGEGMEIDHWDGNVANGRWRNLREVTRSQNMLNKDSDGMRLHALNERLEKGVYKLASGNYAVAVNKVYHGTFKTMEEANAIATQLRAEIYGQYDVAARPELFSGYHPSNFGTVIDTDRAVKGRFYCPRVGRLFVCKEYGLSKNGFEYGISTRGGTYQVRIERKRIGTYATVAEASEVAHKAWDEHYGDNGLFVGVRRRYWA